jgi:DNA-binding IclR family transcriptional regulator
MTNGKGVKEKKLYNLDYLTDALALLNLLSDAEDGLSLMELTSAGRLSKNKAFRVLSSFEHNGVLEKDARGRYSLGTTAFVTARKIVSRNVPMEKIRAVMEKLAGELDEAVYFANNVAGQATLMEMVEGSHKVRARSFLGAVLGDGSGRKNLRGERPKVIGGVTICCGTIDPEVTTVSIDIANNSGALIGSLVVLAPSFRMPLQRVSDEVIPVLEETIRQVPQLAACETKRPVPTVLKLVPKRNPGRGARLLTTSG